MNLGKPYRTKAQKALAQKTVRKDEDGAYRSSAPFSFHGIRGEFIWSDNGFPINAKSKMPLTIWKK